MTAGCPWAKKNVYNMFTILVRLHKTGAIFLAGHDDGKMDPLNPFDSFWGE